MTGNKDPNNQQDIYEEFDKLSNDFKKKPGPDRNREPEQLTPLQLRRKTRSERLAEEKSGNQLHIIKNQIGSAFTRLTKLKTKTDMKGDMAKKKPGKKSKRKYRINIKKLILTVLCLFILAGIGTAAYVYSVIRDAAPIDPNNIYSRLSENSVLYDDSGEVIDSIYNSPDGKRTNIAFADMPADLYNAFVAIEDKTFWTHNGFNVIRMFGAIRDSILGGGKISGTSTISQQLARNIYLADSRDVYSLKRKILEAYYTVIIEKYLTKQQIIEAYLNTIQLGFNSSGVQAAAQAYFSKNVGDLDLTECVALAALPKAPTTYALVKTFDNGVIPEGDESVLARGSTYTYVYNGDATIDRRSMILRFMKEQGYIDDARYQAALLDNLRNHMNVNQGGDVEYSSYFTDYVINKVLSDLMKEYGYDSDEAKRVLYNNGLRIYSTVNTATQKIIEKEFADNANLPKVTNLKKNAGNIMGQNGNILLYSYDNYFDSDGNFTLAPSEFEKLPDGRLVIFADKRLNFYKTEVQGNTDYSIEFKNMYAEIDKIFYSISGGYISIPQKYKTRDPDGNLEISAQFFADYPDFFTSSDAGLTISNKNYSLKQYVIQPQSAMVITDYKTGQIKAMVGGRNTVGRQLFNRADSPRQPGSSIKPMGVYGPALQSAVDALNGGSQNFGTAAGDGDNAAPATNMYGKFWTAASVIDDSPLTVGDKTWPKNWYNAYRGLYTLRTAVEQSVNVCAVKVFNEVGADYSYQFLKKLGITTVVDSGPTNDMNPAALALGGMTKGISPLEMAGGYGAFANQGLYVEPIAYTKVTNKYGQTLLENIPLTTQVMDPGVAFIMTDILRTTVSSGIAGAAAIGIQPVAGKTGTTTDNFDAWFVGLTPQYAASLWIGNDIGIELSQGSVSASKLWSKIMKQVCSGLPAATFAAAPSDVVSATIDTKSGLLPSDISALDPRGTIRSEYFVNGTVPTDTDNIHTFVKICRQSGYLATPLCTDCVLAFGVQRPYIPDPAVGDINYEVPHYYCFIHNPDPSVYPINVDAQWQYNWEGQQITQELPEPENPGYPVEGENTGENPSGNTGENTGGNTVENSGGATENPADESGNTAGNQAPDVNYNDMPEDLRPL